MEAASSYAFLKRKPVASPRQMLEKNLVMLQPDDLPDDEPDTNVISVKFNTLKTAEENLQMGDPHFCKFCRACVSSNSEIFTKAEYQAKFKMNEIKEVMEEEDKEEEKKEVEPEKKQDQVITTAISDNDKVWVCEFCHTHNLLNLDQEEIPQADDVVYLLKSAEQISKNPQDLTSDITTVFCIDNSGSMSVTQEIQGKHDIKHGLSEEEYEMLKQFIEYGADQHLPNQNKDITYITRKQCVLAAIENQLLEMKNEFPNRKVGLVTFNSEVCVIGDGKNLPEVITGDKLYKYDILRQIGEHGGDHFISSTVKSSAESLIKKFEGLKEAGKTALGPALLVSLCMAAQGKQGSRVILCTDGLANIGLGEMDTVEGLAKAEDFYIDLATFAKDRGVSISVITIKGEGCKLGVLSKLADLTSGSLIRVDPNEITNQFANVMKDEVIGTQVNVKLRLHKGLKFRNESEDLLKERGSLYEKDVGNVTAKTEITFEYETRPDEELMEFGIDITKLQTVPFQAQIIYTSTTGDKLLRVITKKLQTTEKLEEAEKNIKMKVLATRALHRQAQVASLGKYKESEQIGKVYGNYLNNQMDHLQSEESLQVNKFYQEKNMMLQHAANKKEIRKNKKASKPSTGVIGKFMGLFQKKEASPPPSGGMNSNDVKLSESLDMERRYSSGCDSDSEHEIFHEAKNFNEDKFA